ncbi:MAG: hypothetical protein AUK03_00765 [Anaerolineae bacterium CG2_30_64_16]|nr:MAG: hypothetical protein AUK03_00765 [Anaerolineae bacterium CG2_30_64_16]
MNTNLPQPSNTVHRPSAGGMPQGMPPKKMPRQMLAGYRWVLLIAIVADLLVWLFWPAQAATPGVKPPLAPASVALPGAVEGCPDPLATLRAMTDVNVEFGGRHIFRQDTGATNTYHQSITLAEAYGVGYPALFGLASAPQWAGLTFSQDAVAPRTFNGELVWQSTLRGHGVIAADGKALESIELAIENWYPLMSGVPAVPGRQRKFVLAGPIPLTSCGPDAVEFSVTGPSVQARVAQVVATNATAFVSYSPWEWYESTDWAAAPTPWLTVRFSAPVGRIQGLVVVPLTHVASNLGFPAAVRQSGKAPLAGVKVDLVQLKKDAAGHDIVDAVLATTTTKEDGWYTFAVPVTTSLAISTSLQSPEVRVFDASAAPPGLGYGSAPPYLPTPATDVQVISSPFDVPQEDALICQDVLFDVDQGHTSPQPGTPAAARLSDFGLIYYHARQAYDLTAKLGLTLDTRPAPIYAHFPDLGYGAYWWGPNSAGGNLTRPPHIVVDSQLRGGLVSSNRNSPDRPDNREWHEFGHHVQADAFDNLLPKDLANTAHVGYVNASTTDSWAEGFAEFYSMLVNREVAQDGTLPQVYHWSGGATNLEANVLSWRFRETSWEEWAVASLLWDLLDPVDERDMTVLTAAGSNGLPIIGMVRDHVQVDLPSLWSDLTAQVAGAYHHILTIKQLYDVLKARGVGQEPLGPGGMTALDELFVAHGFFTDTGPHQFYYDAGEAVGSSGHLTVTVGTGASQIVVPAQPVRASPPLAPEGWVRLDARNRAGNAVAVSSYTVDVRFDAPFENYDFSFEGRPLDGKLFVLTADAQYPATISIRPAGYDAEPFTLRNDFAWNAPADSEGVIDSHTFVVEQQVYLPLVLRPLPPAPTPTPTRTATPTPTRTATPPAESGIQGRMTYNAAPAAGIELRLRFYDGSTYSTASTTQTDGQGRYRFADVPSLGAGQFTYVRYGPNSSDPEYLNAWYGPSLTSYTAGASVPGGDFDLANVSLSAPAHGATTPLPITFVWQKRSVPADTYRLVLFDPENNDTWTTNSLGNTDRLTLTTLPEGVMTGKQYGWYVEVWQGDDSYGVSYYYRLVTFTTTGSRVFSEPTDPIGLDWNRAQRGDN